MGGIFDYEDGDAMDPEMEEFRSKDFSLHCQSLKCEGLETPAVWVSTHDFGYCWNCMTGFERGLFVDRSMQDVATTDHFPAEWARKEREMWAYYGRPLALSVNVGPA